MGCTCMKLHLTHLAGLFCGFVLDLVFYLGNRRCKVKCVLDCYADHQVFFRNALMTMAGNSLVPHEYFTLARHYQTHTQADKEKMIQLFRSLIQHGFRRQNWEPTTPMLRAFMRADPAERGYLSVSEILRCVKAVRAPVPMPVMTTYLDLVADPENKIYYTPMVKNLDWIVSPGKKLSDVPQTVSAHLSINNLASF